MSICADEIVTGPRPELVRYALLLRRIADVVEANAYDPDLVPPVSVDPVTGVVIYRAESAQEVGAIVGAWPGRWVERGTVRVGRQTYRRFVRSALVDGVAVSVHTAPGAGFPLSLLPGWSR